MWVGARRGTPSAQVPPRKPHPGADAASGPAGRPGRRCKAPTRRNGTPSGTPLIPASAAAALGRGPPGRSGGAPGRGAQGCGVRPCGSGGTLRASGSQTWRVGTLSSSRPARPAAASTSGGSSDSSFPAMGVRRVAAGTGRCGPWPGAGGTGRGEAGQWAGGQAGPLLTPPRSVPGAGEPDTVPGPRLPSLPSSSPPHCTPSLHPSLHPCTLARVLVSLARCLGLACLPSLPARTPPCTPSLHPCFLPALLFPSPLDSSSPKFSGGSPGARPSQHRLGVRLRDSRVGQLTMRPGPGMGLAELRRALGRWAPWHVGWEAAGGSSPSGWKPPSTEHCSGRSANNRA